MKKSLGFQANYSSLHGSRILIGERRLRKAKQIELVLQDYADKYIENKSLKDFSVLDIGCSTGIIDNYLSNRFKRMIGIDIDENSIKIAKKNYIKENLGFQVTTFEEIKQNNFFDLIICNSILEHVPDQKKLLASIYRLLKGGGICFLAVPNKFALKEAHYDLYFLSWFPQVVANLYLKITKKGGFYYETPVSYWKLLKLCMDFIIFDYTLKIIKNPERFGFAWRIKKNSFLTKVPMTSFRMMEFLSPNFIFILKKI